MQTIQAFQAMVKEARKKEMEVIEEMRDLASPNSWLRWLGVATHVKDFSDKRKLLCCGYKGPELYVKLDLVLL